MGAFQLYLPRQGGDPMSRYAACDAAASPCRDTNPVLVPLPPRIWRPHRMRAPPKTREIRAACVAKSNRASKPLTLAPDGNFPNLYALFTGHSCNMVRLVLHKGQKSETTRMTIICSWCRLEGCSGIVGEKAPLEDPRETHGICVRHYRVVQARWNRDYRTQD